MPIQMKLNDPRSMKAMAVAGFAPDRSSCGKNRTSATKMTAVWSRP